MKALNHLMRDVVALVLDLFDLVCFVPHGADRREHVVEQQGPFANLLSERDEVIEETVLTRYQSEGHDISLLGRCTSAWILAGSHHI